MKKTEVNMKNDIIVNIPTGTRENARIIRFISIRTTLCFQCS